MARKSQKPGADQTHVRDSNDDKRIEALLPDLIAFRRDLHAHPETAFNEHRTARLIAERLEALPGMSVRRGVAGTGVVATLGGKSAGQCLAFRADMDALPMDDGCGKPHASTFPGVAHACGHDGHVACLLGAATLMAESPARLAGPVKFIFQPAEEGGGGARHMIDEGALENPKPGAIFALHGWPDLPAGTIGFRSGPVMASTDAIDITVHGRGTHAGYPHLGIDPVVTAAQMVVSLQTAASRFRDPLDPVVLTFGSFHSGTARNVVPATASLQGTLRTLSEKQRNTMKGLIRQVAEQTAAAFGARAEVAIVEGYPVTSNDPELTSYLRQTAESAFGKERVKALVSATMGGEDFSFYQQRIPGCIFRLGVARPDAIGAAVPLHHPAYDFNDDSIATGVAVLCALAFTWGS